VTLHHASQPFALFRDGLVPTLPELVFDLPQLRPHSLRDRDPPQPEPSMLGLPTEMSEPKEIERLRLPETTSRSAPGGMPSELDQPGLVRVQLQPKLRKPLTKVGPEPPRVLLVLETHSEIISEPHNDHVAVREPFPPPLDPQVEDVVQVHVSQPRRYRCPLR
jgi:hypothetical protein